MSYADYLHCHKCDCKAIYAPDYEGDSVVFCGKCAALMEAAIKAAREVLAWQIEYRDGGIRARLALWGLSGHPREDYEELLVSASSEDDREMVRRALALLGQ